jgi:hypothetical protein
MEEVVRSLGLLGYPAQVVAYGTFDTGPGAAAGAQCGEEGVMVVRQIVEIELGRKFFLAAEVVVDAAHARTRPDPEVIDGRASDTIGQEAVQGGVEYRLTP